LLQVSGSVVKARFVGAGMGQGAGGTTGPDGFEAPAALAAPGAWEAAASTNIEVNKRGLIIDLPECEIFSDTR
jgi:hypothetical protein